MRRVDASPAKTFAPPFAPEIPAGRTGALDAGQLPRCLRQRPASVRPHSRGPSAPTRRATPTATRLGTQRGPWDRRPSASAALLPSGAGGWRRRVKKVSISTKRKNRQHFLANQCAPPPTRHYAGQVHRGVLRCSQACFHDPLSFYEVAGHRHLAVRALAATTPVVDLTTCEVQYKLN